MSVFLKRLAVAAGVTLSSCIIAGAGLELVLRAVQGFYFAAPDYIQPDPRLGTTLRPSLRQMVGIGRFRNHLSHNTCGLRGAEIRSDRPALRVVLVGDSYTYGWGTDNEGTIAAQLERTLREDGVDAEVLNLGVGGYSTIQSYRRLQDFLDFEPDVVVYWFCANDDRDNLNFLAGKLHRRGNHRAWWRTLLRRHCLTYYTYAAKRGWRLDRHALKDRRRLDFRWEDLYWPGEPEGERVTVTLDYTDSIAAAAESVGAKFYIGFVNVAVTPEDSVVYSRWADFYARRFRERGYRLVPPPQEFAPYRDDALPLLGDVPFMGHFNARGYKFFADALYKSLREDGVTGEVRR